MTKRWTTSLLICFLAVLLLAGLVLPVESRAEDVTGDSGTAGDAVTWTLDNKGTLTISGTGEMTSTPWITDYRTVIKKVVIEEGVTNVCNSAFYQCTSLAEVSLPSTLTKIGSEAFDSCSALTAVVLPEGVTTLGMDAFENCSKLDHVTIPSTLTTLGSWSLSCGTIDNLYITSLEQWCGLNLAGSYVQIGNLYVNGKLLTELVIPENMASIPANTFDYWESLEKVTIPDHVTSVGQHAFYGCKNLKEVSIGNGVTSITSQVFGNCATLTSLTLPASVLVVNSNAFYGGDIALAELRFMGNAPLIAADAFTRVTATVYYSANNASWTEDIFQDYGGTITWLPDTEIPDVEDVPEIYIIASGFCGGNVRWELDSTFTLRVFGEVSRARTASYDMDDYANPGDAPWAAYSDQIKQVVVEDTVTSVGENAFADCGSLNQVTIGESVQDVGANAFSGCESLTEIYFQGSAPTLGENCFAEVEATVNHPAGDESWTEETFTGTGATVTLQPQEPEEHVHSYVEEITEPSCTEDGYTTHTCACGDSYQDTPVPAVGHSWADGSCEICGEADPDWTAPTEHTHDYVAKVTLPTCLEKGYTTYSCACGESFMSDIVPELGHTESVDAGTAATCTESGLTEGSHCAVCGEVLREQTVIPATGHIWIDGSCETCGEADPDWVAPTEPTEPSEPEDLLRIAGDNRFDTAFKVADQMKKNLGVDKFDAVIVASGTNFADALSGSYLAAVKNAPILLSFNDKYNNLAKEYIRENLKEGGTVYILGGISAVPASMEKDLEGFVINRLDGKDRFETNLSVLLEAGVGDKPILVCTGLSFADSLSASASELPIFLVWKDLTDMQKAFLNSLNGNQIYVIGGDSAVSKGMEEQLSAYSKIKRIGGGNRFETSVAIAEEFFDAPDAAVLAYVWNFPDGLCGGPLAAAMDAPLILTMKNYESAAANYVQSRAITRTTILGGESLIPQSSVSTIRGE